MLTQPRVLSPQAARINRHLTELLIERINHASGNISFAEFMHAALYEPELGYYQNQLHKLGEKGDFVTAPELGDLFAQCLANSLLSLEAEMTQAILEIGAGTGRMAAGVLLSLAKANQCPLQYSILEPSASLQSLQRQTIETRFNEVLSPEQALLLLERVVWLSRLPDHFNGVILANEVMDAIACERLVKQGDGWFRLGVGFDGQDFGWQVLDQVGNDELPQVLHTNLQLYCDHYVTEVRPLLKPWLKGLANSLHRGCVVLIDYGYPQVEYYHPQRLSGSLRCFSRHQASDDPLLLLGLQDITAHVDFTQVALDAQQAGFEVTGFTTQAGFLLENGIEACQPFSHELAEQDELIQTVRLSQEIQKLLLPGQMGEVFKVICLNKNYSSIPCGFGLQDHLHRL